MWPMFLCLKSQKQKNPFYHKMTNPICTIPRTRNHSNHNPTIWSPNHGFQLPKNNFTSTLLVLIVSHSQWESSFQFQLLPLYFPINTKNVVCALLPHPALHVVCKVQSKYSSCKSPLLNWLQSSYWFPSNTISMHLHQHKLLSRTIVT